MPPTLIVQAPCLPGRQAARRCGPPPLAAAFRPILDATTGRPFAYEALARGPGGETIHHPVIARCRLEAPWREQAIVTAAAGLVGSGVLLSLPVPACAAEDADSCLQPILAGAARAGLVPAQLLLEVAEDETADPARLERFGAACRAAGLRMAVHDRGGSAGRGRLEALRPEVLKLDKALVREVAADPAQQKVLRCIARLCRALGMRVVAKGVRSAAGYAALRDLGIELFEGALIGLPAIGRLPPAVVPQDAATGAERRMGESTPSPRPAIADRRASDPGTRTAR